MGTVHTLRWTAEKWHHSVTTVNASTQKNSSCLRKTLATGKYTHQKSYLLCQYPWNLNQTTPTHYSPFKWVAHKSGATHGERCVLSHSWKQDRNCGSEKGFWQTCPGWQPHLSKPRSRDDVAEEELSVTSYSTCGESTIFHVYNKKHIGCIAATFSTESCKETCCR